MRATMEYFIMQHGVRDYKHLISFDRKDTFGQAGYDGLVGAYRALQASNNLVPLPSGSEPIKRLRYDRESATSATDQGKLVGEYIKGVVEAASTENHTFGIEMTDTYDAADPFIRAVETWKSTYPNKRQVTIVYSNVSFVGPNSLANRLKGLDLGNDTVLVSQVVPNYMEDHTDLATAYNDAQTSPARRNFTSFEGYIAGRVFIAGLLAHSGEFTSENLVRTFETLQTEAGIELGTSSGFSQADHNYSKSVWGTEIQPDGTFENRFFWREGSRIQIYI